MSLLFWPCMIASLIISILAIRLKKPKLLIVSSILILPMSLYLAASPRFEIWGIIFPFFYLGAASALVNRLIWLTIILILPNILLVGWLGIVVISQ